MTTTFRWSAITVDCADPVTLAGFWQSLLGGEVIEPLPGCRRVVPAEPGMPSVTFQPVPEPKTQKNRLHLDLIVDDADAAIATVVDLGGAETGHQHVYPEGVVTVMADPEGNEFCVIAYTR